MKTYKLVGSIAALVITAAASANAASILNLTTETFDGVNAADSGFVNGAFFDVTFQQPTGTGVIDPFLRLQGRGRDGDAEGMNTSARNVLDNKAGRWTHDLRLSDLVDNNGYYQFLLDINEANQSRSLLSLDKLTISTADAGGLKYSDVRQPSIATMHYDLDGGGNASILLDAARNHGSGSGDLMIYIPTSLFAGADPDSYVYLYAVFGWDVCGNQTSALQATGGFEEFAAVRTIGAAPGIDTNISVTPVPEPGSALTGLLLLGVAGMRFSMRSRPRA